MAQTICTVQTMERVSVSKESMHYKRTGGIAIDTALENSYYKVTICN